MNRGKNVILIVLGLALSASVAACGAAPLKPVSYPSPPRLPPMEPVKVPEPPQLKTATVEEVRPPAVVEHVVAPRPVPDLTGKGMTISGTTARVQLADTEAASVVSGVDGLGKQLARRMLRAGYTRFLDARALRTLDARQEVSGQGSRLTLSGKLHQVALVGKVPRVDYILSVQRLTARKVTEKVKLPVRADAAAVKGYLAALKKAQATRRRQLDTLQQTLASYTSTFNRARKKADDQLPLLEPEDRARLQASYEEARRQYGEVTARFTRTQARLTVKLPDHQAEARRLSLESREEESEFAVASALLTLMDAATGETLVALSYSGRHVRGADGMDRVVDALVRRLLTATPGMKLPGKSAGSTASKGGV